MPQKRSALTSNDAAKKKSKPSSSRSSNNCRKETQLHLLVATFWTRSFGNTGNTFYLPGETVPTPPGAMKSVLKNSKLNAEFDSGGPETQCENQ
jgi:hypothetical protein